LKVAKMTKAGVNHVQFYREFSTVGRSG